MLRHLKYYRIGKQTGTGMGDEGRDGGASRSGWINLRLHIDNYVYIIKSKNSDLAI